MKNYFKPEEYVGLDEYSKVRTNLLGRILHNKRFNTINKLVKKYNLPNQNIIDLCCGLCEWNLEKIKITGLDINKKALKIAKKSGRISEIIEANVLENNLKGGFFDIVIASQILEHMENPDALIIEFRRLLKNNGILILAVPYDTFFSLWRPLFFIRYLWDGIIKRNEYFLKKGGHINRFSPKILSNLLKSHGFRILEIVNDFKFSFTIVAKRIS